MTDRFAAFTNFYLYRVTARFSGVWNKFFFLPQDGTDASQESLSFQPVSSRIRYNMSWTQKSFAYDKNGKILILGQSWQCAYSSCY
jgi:hypothetical protein